MLRPVPDSSANLEPVAEPQTSVADALGAQLLAALPTLRLQSACLLDAHGEPLWLSEGMLGPDEQAVIHTALATFSATSTKAHAQELFGDSQGALFLAIRTEQWQLSGMLMLLMDARALGSGNLAARILTSAMRDLLQQTALTLETIHSPQLPTLTSKQVLDTLEPQSAPAPASEPEPVPALDLALDLTGTRANTHDLPLAPGGARSTMLLQEFTRLRPGGNSRRFKVSPEDESQRGNAVVALEQLLVWMRKNPAALQGVPLSFTIAVSGSALKDEWLTAKLAALLDDAPLAARQVGFEIREPAGVALRPQVERLLAWCERAGCFAVIDDFSFDSAGLDLLRSSAVKLLKLDARLGSEALRDKLAQARVIAIAQAAKVLGLHCVSKYIDSRSGRNWFTAVGFDFTQSMATEPLEHLLP